MHWLAHYEELITTAIGERHRIVLNDGTTIDMNTDTVLRMELLGVHAENNDRARRSFIQNGDERFRPLLFIQVMVPYGISAPSLMLCGEEEENYGCCAGRLG